MKTTIEYETPAGTFGTWEEAAARCESMDMDPTTCIRVVKS